MNEEIRKFPSKKICFVYDKKSGDLLAPVFVPNHVVAIRNYSSMKDDKNAIFNKFPGDFDLLTFELNSDSVYSSIFSSKPEITSFVDIVGDDNGQ